MNTTRMKWVLRLAPGIVAVAPLLGESRPASAGECFQNLARCFQRAAAMRSYGWMWLAGLDCELDFTDCTRRMLIGR